MKKITVFFTAALLLVVFATQMVTAEEPKKRIVDQADLLDEYDEKELADLLNEISERQQFDIVIVTVDSTGDRSPMEYADDFFDEGGYGYGADHSGTLLLVSMEERDWWVSTTGFGITALTDWGIGYIADEFVPFFSDGDFAFGFTLFAENCDEFVTAAKEGTPYDENNPPEEPFPVFFGLLVAGGIGLVTGLIATGVMKGKLKSVRPRGSAADYVKRESMQITNQRDIYMYHHIRRVERPKQTSSGGSTVHRSSSGRSHGGRGGKF